MLVCAEHAANVSAISSAAMVRFMSPSFRAGINSDVHNLIYAISDHSHTIAHTHGIPHTHGTPAHQHTVPGHTHALTVTYGVIKETMPASHSVTLKVYELVSSTWTLRATIAALTADIEDVDLTQWVNGPGAWRLELKGDAAQPNGGRLGCDVVGYALGAIQSS